MIESEALRNSPSLRRLLSYLGEAVISGTAHDLKEYVIGRDVMGRPEDYDPRVDASVRVQIGKLRQKLDQYYATEAPESPRQIHLPRGHFQLVLQDRPEKAVRVESPKWRTAALLLTVLLAVAIGLNLYTWHQYRSAATASPVWAPELAQFWGPFLSSRRPMIFVLGSPLFVRFHDHYFRNPWANDWGEVEKLVPLDAISRLLSTPTEPAPTYRWAPFGETVAAFRMAQVLGRFDHELVMKRSTVLAWEDVRSSNLVFLGPRKFNRQLQELPLGAGSGRRRGGGAEPSAAGRRTGNLQERFAA